MLYRRRFTHLFALAALLVVSAGASCGRPSATQPGIRGDIQIVNDCDGRVQSIASHVKVTGDLIESPPANPPPNPILQSVGDTDSVGPLGVDPQGNPIKRGSYNLRVTWPTTARAPGKWVLNITKPDGTPICRSIPCAGPARCVDAAPKPVEFAYTGWAMTKMLRVDCQCVQ